MRFVHGWLFDILLAWRVAQDMTSKSSAERRRESTVPVILAVHCVVVTNKSSTRADGFLPLGAEEAASSRMMEASWADGGLRMQESLTSATFPEHPRLLYAFPAEDRALAQKLLLHSTCTLRG